MEDGAAVRDIEYLRGLNTAVVSGVEYGLEVLAVGEERASRIPLAVLTQSRLAARQRIPLDLVVRRYFAAKTVLNDIVFREAGKPPAIASEQLQLALAAQNSVFDQVLRKASEEYQRETEARSTSREAQKVERVQRLLRGEPCDPASLEYPLDGTHVGLVALSSDVRDPLRKLSREFDSRLLATQPFTGITWAWIGGKNAPDPESVGQWATKHWPESIPLGVGERTDALTGWRRTHSQAQAAAQLAHLESRPVVRYRDVALIAAVAQDPLLLESLKDMYLKPLSLKGNRGSALRTTLLAYFSSRRNTISAAASLGVSRQTVASRLRVIEGRFKRSVDQDGDLLHAVLRLEALRRSP